MMNLAPATFQKLFGLFELDSDGKIIYSRDFSKLGFAATNVALVGRNFFDEVAPFNNVEEFRRHFKYFVKSDQPTENFIFDCQYDGAVISVKVKISQVSEREFDERKNLFIVDIREF